MEFGEPISRNRGLPASFAFLVHTVSIANGIHPSCLTNEHCSELMCCFPRIQLVLSCRGTVCDDLASDLVATVACRQLGIGSEGLLKGNARPFGEGTGPIHLAGVRVHGHVHVLQSAPSHSTPLSPHFSHDFPCMSSPLPVLYQLPQLSFCVVAQFECKGTEAQIQDCPRRLNNTSSCRHYDDMGVVCYDPPGALYKVSFGGISAFSVKHACMHACSIGQWAADP